MLIEPGALSYDAHGAPINERYGDVYASRDGALGQARHVFLDGTACADRWRGRSQFVILETGFGLGVNFLAAWQAWREDAERPRRLHFVSVERHPLPGPALVEAVPAELKALATELTGQWPLPMPGLHRCEFEQGRVALTLAFGDARALVPRLQLGADALFLDGFAPDRNPEMWEPALLRSLARLVRADGRVASWTTARSVRESLAAAGFELDLVPGFGRKRQMLVGRYAPRYTVRRHEPCLAYQGERSAIVVGAGLAGAACAHALARRDWRVTLIEAARPAAEASGLPWGSMHPHFATDDNLLARLTRAGSAATTAALRRVARDGRHADEVVWVRDGVFQQAADGEIARRWRAALEGHGWPSSYVQWLDQVPARLVLGLAPARSGLWWPGGLLASPARWIGAILDDPRIALLQACAGSLERTVDGWVVRGTDGSALARAPIVIAASASDTPRLLASRLLPVRSVPGQITFLDSDGLAGLKAGLSGDGTLLRAPDGFLAVGATYETALGADAGALDDRMATRSNLARMERMLADAVEVRVSGRFAGVRCVSRDRLPYAGPATDETAAIAGADRLRGAHLDDLPRRPGLYASFALGSRGLTFAAMAAEVIVSRIEGEPLPIERDLAGALDPGRVLLRRLRKGAVNAGSVSAEQ
jgi:tRNA 5-methylaminomethyl-2-thiouridine biosynthesis bifunctional protein